MKGFSLYWLKSELKRRHVWTLGLLVTLGIGGLVFVDLFSQRLSNTATQDTRKFLSADYRVSSWEKLDPNFYEELTQIVPSQNALTERTLIASLRNEKGIVSAISLAALEDAYPFYGDWKTELNLKILDLKDGEVFLDLAAKSKGFAVGQTVSIGTQKFVIRDFVELEPQAVNFFRVGQFKVWMRLANLESTGLAGPGSRVRSQVYLKAPGSDAKEFRETFRSLFPNPNWRLRSADQSNAQAQRTVLVLRSYLAFVSLCATLLGIVGLFFLFVSDLEKRLPTYLTLRCLGLSDRGLLQSTVLPVLISAILGATGGFFLGAWAESQLSSMAAKQLNVEFAQSQSYLMSYLLALATSLIALAPVIYFPIKALLKTPTQILFSGLSSGSSLSASFNPKAIATCLVFTLGLSWLTTKSLILSVLGFLGVSLGLGILGLLLWLFIRLLQKQSVRFSSKGFTLFYLTKSFTQKKTQTFVWVLSIAFSLFFLSLGLVLASSIHQQIAMASTGNAPNLLTLGMTGQDFKDHQSKFPPNTEWVPYVQARIFEIDGTPIQEVNKERNEDIDTEGGNGPQIREYFVNVRDDESLFNGEKIEEGDSLFARLSPQASKESKSGVDPPVRASLEEGFAERMGLSRVGTPFVLELAGVRLKATVSSIRKVQWFQFRPNFFIILKSEDIQGAPLSYSALSQVSGGEIAEAQQNIVSLVPHASPVDLTQTGKQIQGLLDKLLLTIESSSLFLFFAALLVLAAVSWAKRSEKSAEFALLKCLGLTKIDLRKQLVAEICLSIGFAWLLTWILVLPSAQFISLRFFSADISLPEWSVVGAYTIGLSAVCFIIYMALNIGLTQKSTSELFQENEI